MVDILKNVPEPQPDQKDEDLSIYQSRIEIDKVLEVNAGMADFYEIKVGDQIIIK